MISLNLTQNTCHAAQGARFDSHPLSHASKWPRLSGSARRNQRPNGIYFFIVYGSRNMVETNDSQEPWSLQNRQPVVRIKSAEKISGKKRQLEILNTVGPAFSAGVER